VGNDRPRPADVLLEVTQGRARHVDLTRQQGGEKRGPSDMAGPWQGYYSDGTASGSSL
jgi:hypothetical protein